MTVYAKLKKQKDNFIHAAANAKDSIMIALWTKRAEETQRKIDDLTIEEAIKEIQIN